jgi:hypothetical protein
MEDSGGEKGGVSLKLARVGPRECAPDIFASCRNPKVEKWGCDMLLDQSSRIVLLALADSTAIVSHAFAQTTPERNAYFGETHVHTS